MTFVDFLASMDWKTILTGLAASGLGYAGIRASTRSQKDVALDPDWENFTTHVREWADKQIAEADAEAEEERTRRRTLQQKYRAALRGLRSILIRHPGEREHLAPEVQNA